MSDEILTGEAVLIDVRPAGVLSRVGAQLLDVFVYFVFIAMILMILGNTVGFVDEAFLMAVLIGVTALPMVILPVTLETITRGKTLGKLITGIRIVRDDGGPIRFRHALVRALTGILELWMTFGSVAFITSMLNQRGKRLGDLLAGTYAVRDRIAPYASAPLHMPLPLAAWAGAADIRRLPDGLALNARQYLARYPTLTPASRDALGLDLAAQVERYVAPAPPLGTPPYAFLQAVLAERRDREYSVEMAGRQRGLTLTNRLTTLPHAIPDPPN